MLQKIINTVYSFGAAIVVFGAWAKIENKSFASDALTAGLMVEVSVFCVYGLLEWRKTPETPPAEIHRTPKDLHPDLHELTTTVRRTNNILSKVFRAE